MTGKPSLPFLIPYDLLSFPNVATELFRDAVPEHTFIAELCDRPECEPTSSSVKHKY